MALLTFVNPLLFNKTTNFLSISNKAQQGSQSNCLRVQAIATKWEPTKVVPQADRVLVRLEQLGETGELVLQEQDERALGLHLQQFAEVVEVACSNLPPNIFEL